MIEKDLKINSKQLEVLKQISTEMRYRGMIHAHNGLKGLIKQIEDADTLETLNANNELDIRNVLPAATFGMCDSPGKKAGVCTIPFNKESELKINREQLERLVFHIGSIAEEQTILSLHLKKIVVLTREIVENDMKENQKGG